MTPHDVVGLFDGDRAKLFRWSPTEAVVVVDSAALMWMPWSGGETLRVKEPDERARGIVQGLLSGQVVNEAMIGWGELVLWASRIRQGLDVQLVLDIPFNRRLLREAIQHLVQVQPDADAQVKLSILDALPGSVLSIAMIGVPDHRAFIIRMVNVDAGDDPCPHHSRRRGQVLPDP